MLTQIEIALSDSDIDRIATAVAAKLARLRPAPSTKARLNIQEVAAEMRCSTRQVRRLIAIGRLASESLDTGGSSRVLVRRTELDRFWEASAR